MPTSAFKSPSRTSVRKDQIPTYNRNHRRSKSVTPFSRTHLDTISEFNNTRDNPLFWVDGSEPEFEAVSPKNGVLGGFKGSDSGKSRRGRSELRNSGGGDGGGGVGAASRRRSLSSARRCGNSESGKEQQSGLLSNLSSKSKIGSNRDFSSTNDKNHLVRSASDMSEVLKSWKTWSSQHPASETLDDSAISQSGSKMTQWDDEISIRAISEAKEKSIKPVSVEKAYLWKDDDDKTSRIVGTFLSDLKRGISDVQDLESREDFDDTTSSIFPEVAPELETPNALELVNDFREEFARELEECEERARKLRAELAVEEHRELELSKILNNTVSEPTTPQAQKPLLVKKASTERKKMSKCLEEEAMAYFDECVSISTFEDSDFSSLEDPPHVGRFDNLAVETTSIPGDRGRASVACSFESQDSELKSPPMHFFEHCSVLAAGCSTDSPRTNISNNSTTKRRFSFASESSCLSPFEKYVRNYVKDSGKENSKCLAVRKVSQKTDDYDSKVQTEKFLLDRVVFKGRIDSGSMLLCGGGIDFPGAPFSSGLW